MDEGLFWGFVVIIIITAVLPLVMKGQKWALLSFFGILFGALLWGSLGADGSIVVGYVASGGTFFTTITNSSSLPLTVVEILTLFNVFITIAKAADVL